MAQFSLSWQAHKQNICSGLSALQQNGEFVDMTLAADGYHVKVHQMVMSLVSPYIKELLASAQCPHPVIFLNKISYPTLCAMLEYIYTGEVLVSKENLPELVEAGKELRIKGLEDVKIELQVQRNLSQTMRVQCNEGQPLTETGYFGKQDSEAVIAEELPKNNIAKTERIQNTSWNISNVAGDISATEDSVDHDMNEEYLMDDSTQTSTNKPKALGSTMQYTISNQGALQMILNRYLYYIRYTSRKAQDGSLARSWKCINYMAKSTKCPASVITKDDIVIKRFGAHNHPFHDKQILKKVRDCAVFTAINEAEEKGQSKKQKREGEQGNQP